MYRSSPRSAGDHLGRHRLAGAGVAGEQRGDAAPAAAARPHPPLRSAPGRGAGRGRRARAAVARTLAGSTRSAQATAGSIRRASRSSPAAFCARAPRRSRPRVDRRRRRAARPAAPTCTARPICVGTEDEVRGHGSRVDGASSVPRCRRSSSARRARRSARAAAGARPAAAALAATSRVPGAGADQQHRRPAAPASRRSGLAGRVGQRLDRSGDQPGAAQQRLPASDADQLAGVAARRPAGSGRRAHGRPTARRGERGGRRRAAPVPGPLSAEVHEPDPGHDGTREPASAGRSRPAGRRRRARRRRAGSGRSSPSRCAATRSGTRSARVRNGRSASSTMHQRRVDQRRPAASRPRAAAEVGRGGRQLQRQADRGPAPGDVVVEVAVEPLEPAVEVRDERRSAGARRRGRSAPQRSGQRRSRDAGRRPLRGVGVGLDPPRGAAIVARPGAVLAGPAAGRPPRRSGRGRGTGRPATGRRRRRCPTSVADPVLDRARRARRAGAARPRRRSPAGLLCGWRRIAGRSARRSRSASRTVSPGRPRRRPRGPPVRSPMRTVGVGHGSVTGGRGTAARCPSAR